MISADLDGRYLFPTGVDVPCRRVTTVADVTGYRMVGISCSLPSWRAFEERRRLLVVDVVPALGVGQ